MNFNAFGRPRPTLAWVVQGEGNEFLKPVDTSIELTNIASEELSVEAPDMTNVTERATEQISSTPSEFTKTLKHKAHGINTENI